MKSSKFRNSKFRNRMDMISMGLRQILQNMGVNSSTTQLDKFRNKHTSIGITLVSYEFSEKHIGIDSILYMRFSASIT